jgi:hypothetical protein
VQLIRQRDGVHHGLTSGLPVLVPKRHGHYSCQAARMASRAICSA